MTSNTRMEAKRWLVTGGTGFIGRRLAQSLEADGIDVVVLTRRPPLPVSRRIRQVQWTATDAGAWMDELEGAEVVVHLAGAGVMASRWTDAHLATVRSSRVESTRILSSAIAEAEKKPRVFVSASAVGVYGLHMDDSELTEESPYGTDELAAICQGWEQAADSARVAGVRVVHPRMGIVLGREGGALRRMLPAFQSGLGGPLGSGRQWLSWVHIHDVVDAIRFAAEREVLTGPFNLVAPHPVRMQEFATLLGKVLCRPSRIGVPGWMLRLALGKGAEVLLTGQRAVPTRLLQEGFRFGYDQLKDALSELLTEHD